jgi:hypothetical protein
MLTVPSLANPGTPGPQLSIYIAGFSNTTAVVASLRPTPTGIGIFPPDGQLQIGVATKHLDESVARMFWATGYVGVHQNAPWGSYALDIIEEDLQQ